MSALDLSRSVRDMPGLRRRSRRRSLPRGVSRTSSSRRAANRNAAPLGGTPARAARRPGTAAFWLLGLRRRRRQHVHLAARALEAAELDAPVDQREQGVVLPPPDVQAGIEPGAALPDQDVARAHRLAAETLD